MSEEYKINCIISGFLFVLSFILGPVLNASILLNLIAFFLMISMPFVFIINIVKYIKEGPHKVKHTDWLSDNNIYEKEKKLVIETPSEIVDQLTLERYKKGEDYFYGINGKKEDNSMACFYYEKAGCLGHHADALYKLGYLYYYELIIGSKDKAFDYFKAAAKKGHVEAQRLLGECYIYGIGTQKNSELAAIWSLKAAKAGDIGAMRTLGDVCVSEADYAGGYLWFRKASDQGNVRANLDLAFCYYNGWGTKQNLDLAKTFLARYKAGCSSKSYIPNKGDNANQQEIERCINNTEHIESQNQIEKAEKINSLKELPITGDYFVPTSSGYCIHTGNYGTCKYCSRRSWNSTHWEDGYSCRLL